MTRFPFALVALAVGGCSSLLTTYLHLDAPVGVMRLETCASGGPPVLARYERKGATFDVTMEPRGSVALQKGFLRVRAPEGVAVTVPEPYGYVRLDAGGPPIRFTLREAETRQLKGMTERLFEFEGLPQRIDFAGTLHLPDVLVGNERVITPVFQFHREGFAGPPPGNC